MISIRISKQKDQILENITWIVQKVWNNVDAMIKDLFLNSKTSNNIDSNKWILDLLSKKLGYPSLPAQTLQSDQNYTKTLFYRIKWE